MIKMSKKFHDYLKFVLKGSSNFLEKRCPKGLKVFRKEIKKIPIE